MGRRRARDNKGAPRDPLPRKTSFGLSRYSVQSYTFEQKKKTPATNISHTPNATRKRCCPFSRSRPSPSDTRQTGEKTCLPFSFSFSRSLSGSTTTRRLLLFYRCLRRCCCYNTAAYYGIYSCTLYFLKLTRPDRGKRTTR